jgi:uncharacterized alkaline shock family protein YloU
VDREQYEVVSSPLGRIAVSNAARIVVEHGLKLAEVATAVRSRVQYEVDRMVGIPIARLDVHIEGVRGG